jgi:hypothetical protein
MLPRTIHGAEFRRRDFRDFLNSLVSRTAAVLGDDTYGRMVARHERGRRAPTPPRRPHRLIELTAAAQGGAVYEQTTGSVFPSDLFIQLGDQPPLVT